MTGPINIDESLNTCSCDDESHEAHICWLTHMGLHHAMHSLNNNPTVSCSKCGAKANLPNNVCFPIPLTDQEI
jgi:hypothetical protein